MTSPLTDKLSSEWCDEMITCGTREKIERRLSELIYGIVSQPWLGNATTGQLLDEVKARVNLGYKTAGEDDEFDLAP